MERKGYSTGVADFSTIRTTNRYYVDKTKFVHMLVEDPVFSYFFSRPRRFGKSLFLDTLQCLYEGKKELFEGLYIYDKWDWEKIHPVIKIDFSNFEAPSYSKFENAFLDLIEDCALPFGMTINRDSTVGSCLGRLIRQIYMKGGKKVVVLIDEYDAPMIHMSRSEDEYEKVFTEMRGVLRTLKAHRKYIEFVCMTGILKLSQHDFFSAANVFLDISLKPEYNEICGYTEEELLQTFKAELERDDLDPNINIDQLRKWYDGYRWGGETNLYNPNDILLTFQYNEISSWWATYGLSTVAIEQIRKEKDFTFEEFKKVVSKEYLDDGISLIDNHIKIAIILFQAGYLTIRTPESKSFTKEFLLEPPNLEVKVALARLRFTIFSRSRVDKDDFGSVLSFLFNDAFDELKEQIRYIFAQCVYDEKPQDLRERHFSIIMRSMFLACGLKDVQSEVHTQEGRADLVIRCEDKYYIMEFKVLGVGGVRRGDAMKQLLERRYASHYKGLGRVFLLGFEFVVEHLDDNPDSAKMTLAELDWKEV